jgi:ubiquitin-protein ligase E3 C
MTSHFDMDGFIKDVVHEEEERRIAELNTSDDEDEDEEDLSGTPHISSTIQQQARKNFLSSIGPRLDIVQNLPFFIPFETRVQIFREFIHSDQVRRREGATESSMSRHAFDRWDEMGMGMERGARHHGTIRREKLFDDAIKEFYDLGETLKEPIQITFIDKFGEAEAGIDGGGVTKEFLTSVTKEAFVPSEDGLFCENKDHYLFPNPASILAVRTRAREFGLSPEETQEQVKDVLKRYEFLGRVVGKCLYEGILLEIGFAGFFLLKWAFKGATNDGYRPSVNDLRDLDEDLYNGMVRAKTLFSSPPDLTSHSDYPQKLHRRCRA